MPAGRRWCRPSRSAGSVTESEVSLAVAFTAGLLSFLSPCVLPLIPSYIGFLTGMSGDELQAGARRGAALLHGLWFVAGFTLVFVLLGAPARAGELRREYQPGSARGGYCHPVRGI